MSRNVRTCVCVHACGQKQARTPLFMAVLKKRVPVVELLVGDDRVRVNDKFKVRQGVGGGV